MEGTREIGEEADYMVPNIQESVSVDKDGIVTITLNNLSVTDSEEMEICFMELHPGDVTAAIVTDRMDAYNTFDNPDNVKEETFEDFKITDRGITFTMPACSVVQFRVR